MDTHSLDHPLPSFSVKSNVQILLFIFLSTLFLCSGLYSFADDTADPPLDTQLNEKVLSLPGDPMRPVMLQVTLFKPNGPGPFPLAVLNHGKEFGAPHLEPRYRSVYAARYFVSRGYEVVLPMLRGFAGSGGSFEKLNCNAEEESLMQARDIRAVILDMVKQPDIDKKHIVVFGQSYGGWNTLALGALNVPGVKGLVNFAGGRNAPSCSDWEEGLADGAGQYGKRTKVPSIWFYGDNDSKFSVPTWSEMYKRYTAAGGKAELVAYGNFLDDSHNFLGKIEALPIWIPKVDAFLDNVGLPSKVLYPELLPAAYPAPTDYAAINDVSAIPLINDKGKDSYGDFLTKEMPRVFVIATNGSSLLMNGGYDPLDRAYSVCKQKGWSCTPYAVDDKVVWPKRLPIPPATNFAAIDNVNAVPYLNDQSRKSYQAFLSLAMPRAFAIAANGIAVSSHGGYDPQARALAICKSHGFTCQIYAVDDQVVWQDAGRKY